MLLYEAIQRSLRSCFHCVVSGSSARKSCGSDWEVDVTVVVDIQDTKGTCITSFNDKIGR